MDIIVTIGARSGDLKKLTEVRDLLRAAGMWIDAINPITCKATGSADEEIFGVLRGVEGVVDVSPAVGNPS